MLESGSSNKEAIAVIRPWRVPASALLPIDLKNQATDSTFSDKLAHRWLCFGERLSDMLTHPTMTTEEGMTYIGQLFAIGSKIEAAGVYEHTAIGCGQKHTFSDVGDKFSPCSNPKCKDTSAPWKLVQKTGTA